MLRNVTMSYFGVATALRPMLTALVAMWATMLVTMLAEGGGALQENGNGRS